MANADELQSQIERLQARMKDAKDVQQKMAMAAELGTLYQQLAATGNQLQQPSANDVLAATQKANKVGGATVKEDEVRIANDALRYFIANTPDRVAMGLGSIGTTGISTKVYKTAVLETQASDIMYIYNEDIKKTLSRCVDKNGNFDYEKAAAHWQELAQLIATSDANPGETFQTPTTRRYGAVLASLISHGIQKYPPGSNVSVDGLNKWLADMKDQGWWSALWKRSGMEATSFENIIDLNAKRQAARGLVGDIGLEDTTKLDKVYKVVNQSKNDKEIKQRLETMGYDGDFAVKSQEVEQEWEDAATQAQSKREKNLLTIKSGPFKYSMDQLIELRNQNKEMGIDTTRLDNIINTAASGEELARRLDEYVQYDTGIAKLKYDIDSSSLDEETKTMLKNGINRQTLTEAQQLFATAATIEPAAAQERAERLILKRWQGENSTKLRAAARGGERGKKVYEELAAEAPMGSEALLEKIRLASEANTTVDKLKTQWRPEQLGGKLYFVNKDTGKRMSANDMLRISRHRQRYGETITGLSNDLGVSVAGLVNGEQAAKLLDGLDSALVQRGITGDPGKTLVQRQLQDKLNAAMKALGPGASDEVAGNKVMSMMRAASRQSNIPLEELGVDDAIQSYAPTYKGSRAARELY